MKGLGRAVRAQSRKRSSASPPPLAHYAFLLSLPTGCSTSHGTRTADVPPMTSF